MYKNIDTIHAMTEAIIGPTVMNKAARMSKTKTTVELLPLANTQQSVSTKKNKYKISVEPLQTVPTAST